MVNLKTSAEIEKMKLAGAVAAGALKVAEGFCVEGVSTFEIDCEIKKYIFSCGAEPSFLNYEGFPASSCISINDKIIHGIPSKDDILKEGDIVSVDVGAKLDGFHGDTAGTFKVGHVQLEIEKLIEVTKEALQVGISKFVIGSRIGDVSSAIEKIVTENGLAVVKSFVGHGVGRNLHESPEVPNYGVAGRGLRIEEGLVIAIEPMVNCDESEVEICDDGWGVLTEDGKPSAHFEHTVAATLDGPIILTKV